ncbi:MAG: nucleotidyltransferase family protein [Cyanobacteriota bacterium]|nr:nucleotidyltransferase family protein [Cyanobacteriota bacterium]
MDKQQILKSLGDRKEQLHDFAVKTLWLFGSVARDEAHAESDVDLLVEFEKPVGLLTFIRLKQYLEESLSCSVDLGTPNSLRPDLKETVLKEAIRAF